MSRIFEALKRVSDSSASDSPASGIDLGPLDCESLPSAAEASAGSEGLAVEDSVVEMDTGDASNGSGIRTLPFQITSTTPILTFGIDHWTAVEQYRILRTRVIQHPKRPRAIVVCSAGPGDGKTVTAINLAGTLSLKADSSVVIVDADFRRTSVAKYMGIPESPGLADVIEGSCELESALVNISQLPNLYVLPAGMPRPNPPELLDSPRSHEIFRRLREKFAHIIVDSPPLAAVTDFDLIQALCDGVVLVIRPDHTNRGGCFKAIETVSKEKLLGVVLNCVQEWFLARPYSYGSNYYYHYK